MSESAFDPNLLLAATVTEVNEKRNLLPVDNPASPDGFYTAVIDKLTPKTGTIGKGDRIGQPWMMVGVAMKIEVPQQLQDALKLPPTITLSDSCFLDLTPAGGMDNAPGRNRRQRDYRIALDMNKPGDVWSWERAVGRPLKVKITHKPIENSPDYREEITQLMKV